MGVLALERGDAFLQLHVQGMMRLKTSSTRSLKAEIKSWIGWDYHRPIGGSICINSLCNRGLHMMIGLIGYCLKDEGRRIHSIYGTSKYKHRVELTPANILGRALQFHKYNAKNPLSITFRSCVHEMLRSGQYMAGFRWLTTARILHLRAERIWRACTMPQSIEVRDVDNILFGIDTPTRYFQAGSEGSRKEENDDVKELADKEHSDGPADDDAMSRIPIVDLDRNIDSGADLDHVRDTLLYAGFGVEINTSNNDVKQEKPKDNLLDYCHLWD
ncbi:hypothetical protein R1flu_002800 [Riccia fluitans]|uniref:UBC core domain-containing protein n=1 Tax=Riccia fluitans TaxID=41844 RepID=A0ABD1Y7N9_9MARC